MNQPLFVRDGTNDTDGTADLAAADQSLVVDVSDLDNVTVHVVQETDGGTVSLAIEHSFDGVYFAPIGAGLTEASFAAADGAVVERALEGPNGMPIQTGQIRLHCSAFTAGGNYQLKVAGKRRA